MRCRTHRSNARVQLCLSSCAGLCVCSTSMYMALVNVHDSNFGQSAARRPLCKRRTSSKETCQPAFASSLLRHRSTLRPQRNHSSKCHPHSARRPTRRGPSSRHRRVSTMITRWLALALLLQPTDGLAKGGFATAKPKKKTKKAPKAPKPLEPLPPGLDGVPPVSRFEVLNADGVAPQFAGAFLIEDESVADDLVKEFHERPQLRGMVSNAANGEPVVDTSVKDSLEMSFPANDPSVAWRRYLLSLKAAMGLYLEDYPYAGAYGAFSITGRTNVQLYPPSGGYKTFHTERTGKGEPEGSRHLVFMTYLNDVTDAGGTEFCHQNLIVSPKKGLTLIWPADWTFTHRGVPSPTQEKIITTGWSRAALEINRNMAWDSPVDFRAGSISRSRRE